MDGGLLAVLIVAIVALSALLVRLWRGQALAATPFPRDLREMSDEEWTLLKRTVAGLVVLALIIALVGYVSSELA